MAPVSQKVQCNILQLLNAILRVIIRGNRNLQDGHLASFFDFSNQMMRAPKRTTK